MDENFLESLVQPAKNGDTKAKEKIVSEFDPFMRSFARKTYIDGYTSEDIHSQCVLILLQCIDKYDCSKKTFIGYGISGIKKSIYGVLQKQKKHSVFHGDALTSTGSLENLTAVSSKGADLDYHFSEDLQNLEKLLQSLDPQESELFEYIFLGDNSLKSYSETYEISYYAAYRRYKKLQTKLQKIILY